MKNLITIIVPIYNVEEVYLRKCVESLLKQTLKDIEIVLINDGSTNNSKEICMEYAQKDKRIKLINQSNKGVSSARNTGLDIASAEYIMFVDGDDWIADNCCEKIYREIQEFDLLIFSYNKIYSNKIVQPIHIYDSEKIYSEGKKEFDYYDMRTMGSSWIKLYKKNCIGNERFNENLKNGEDVEFNYRVFKKINSAKFIPDNLYNYEIRKNSLVRQNAEKMIESYIKTLKVMQKEIGSEEKRKRAYYSFMAISFLMICLNHIYPENRNYTERKKKVKELKNNIIFFDLFKNVNQINLPITRKMPILFAKYNLYFFLDLTIKLKRHIQNR